MSTAKKILLVVVILFGVIQLIPGIAKRDNPPVEAEIQASPEVKAVLKRSCYDCHSNETKWLWYSYIAPVSWFLSSHVQNGREEMNFSNWENYEPSEKAHLMKDCWEMVEEGKMPLGVYVPLHPEAKLSEEDKMVIKNWAMGGTSVSSEEDEE